MELLLVALSAFGGASLGVAFIAWQFRKAPAEVRLVRALEPDGKHYHVFDRTAKVPQGPGWYCGCGWRAPEAKQPVQWRKVT